MCGRYALYDTSKSRLNLPSNIVPNFNICPSTKVLIINDQKRPVFIEWNIRAPWSRTLRIINARSETIDKKKAFQNLHRCVFVANGYYEWKCVQNKKIPYYHTFEDSMMYFAGLMNSDGACIVTRPSYPQIAEVHSRQPVILNYNTFDNWFKKTHNYESENSEKMKIFKVSITVNSPKYNSIKNLSPQ